jgi:hypothetical protein
VLAAKPSERFFASVCTWRRERGAVPRAAPAEPAWAPLLLLVLLLVVLPLLLVLLLVLVLLVLLVVLPLLLLLLLLRPPPAACLPRPRSPPPPRTVLAIDEPTPRMCELWCEQNRGAGAFPCPVAARRCPWDAGGCVQTVAKIIGHGERAV